MHFEGVYSYSREECAASYFRFGKPSKKTLKKFKKGIDKRKKMWYTIKAVAGKAQRQAFDL